SSPADDPALPAPPRQHRSPGIPPDRPGCSLASARCLSSSLGVRMLSRHRNRHQPEEAEMSAKILTLSMTMIVLAAGLAAAGDTMPRKYLLPNWYSGKVQANPAGKHVTVKAMLQTNLATL